MSATVGKLLSDLMAVTSMPGRQADSDVESMAFSDLLGHLEADVPAPDVNWSSAGLPVRAHTRRFDETSLLALAAAIGTGASLPETVPDVLDQSPEARAIPAEHAVVISDATAAEGNLAGADPIDPVQNWQTSIFAVPRAEAFVLAARNMSFNIVRPRRSLAVSGRAAEPAASNTLRRPQAGAQIKRDVPAQVDRTGQIFRDIAQAKNLASHAVQVAVCALESGLRVIVKAHGAQIGEPSEMQRAVLNLLAEHGYSQTEIVLVGLRHQYPSGGR